MLPTVKSSSVLYKLNNIAAKCTKSPVLKTSHLKREWSCHTESAHLCPGWIKKNYSEDYVSWEENGCGTSNY